MGRSANQIKEELKQSQRIGAVCACVDDFQALSSAYKTLGIQMPYDGLLGRAGVGTAPPWSFCAHVRSQQRRGGKASSGQHKRPQS
jgi:hypothetical protein